MTGPQKRVLSGYNEIHNRHTRPDEASQKGVCLCVCARDLCDKLAVLYFEVNCCACISFAGSEKKKLFLPELLHNIQLLVEQTEEDIIQTERKLRYNRDLVVNLTHEKEEREAQRDDEEKQIEKLSEILNTIDL